jgi:hypothetical protein
LIKRACLLKEKKYVVALDSKDVSIQGRLSRCIEELEARKCDALFGGEVNYSWGPDKHRIIQDEKYRPPWRHLNAGLSVFRTAFLKSLADLEWDDCDQTTWHRLHHECWPKIQVDDGCSVFQNIDQTTKPGEISVVIGIPHNRR